MRSIRKPLVGLGLAVGIILGGVSPASAHPRQLAAVKDSLERFQHVSYAMKQGFGLVIDVNGVSCINDPAGTGNMGYHYANGALLTDGKIDPFHPEAVLYERHDGDLRLTAIEYIILAQDWGKRQPPELFGEDFMFVDSPNRFGLPPFYMLHAWLWKTNPLGLFNPYNPRVHCP